MKDMFPSTTNRFTTETAKEQGRKGGLAGKGTVSLTRSITQKINYYKSKGMSDENAQEMFEFFQDSKIGLGKLYIIIEKMLAISKTPTQINLAVQRQLDLHKQIHGTKIRTENINLELKQIEVIDEKRDEIIKRLMNVKSNTESVSTDNKKRKGHK